MPEGRPTVGEIWVNRVGSHRALSIVAMPTGNFHLGQICADDMRDIRYAYNYDYFVRNFSLLPSLAGRFFVASALRDTSSTELWLEVTNGWSHQSSEIENCFLVSVQHQLVGRPDTSAWTPIDQFLNNFTEVFYPSTFDPSNATDRNRVLNLTYEIRNHLLTTLDDHTRLNEQVEELAVAYTGAPGRLVGVNTQHLMYDQYQRGSVSTDFLLGLFNITPEAREPRDSNRITYDQVTQLAQRGIDPVRLFEQGARDSIARAAEPVGQLVTPEERAARLTSAGAGNAMGLPQYHSDLGVAIESSITESLHDHIQGLPMAIDTMGLQGNSENLDSILNNIYAIIRQEPHIQVSEEDLAHLRRVMDSIVEETIHARRRHIAYTDTQVGVLVCIRAELENRMGALKDTAAKSIWDHLKEDSND